MAIEINGLPPPGAKRTDTETPATAPRDAPGTTDADKHRRSATDAVSLTDISTRLQDLEKKLAALPVVDAQRVEDIKKALADESYKVDPERVAEKLLRLEGLLDRD